MVVGFTTTYAISAYHHWSEFESFSGGVYSIQHYVIKFVSDLWQVSGFLYTTLCDKVCQWSVAGRWFSSDSSTNKINHHDITEILLKVALNTITLHRNVYFQNFLQMLNYPIKVQNWLSCITSAAKVCKKNPKKTSSV
jgi:hypothetical protein